MNTKRADRMTRAFPLAQNAPRPRTKPKEVRRDELMDAAERLFLEKGVAATSIDEIVAGADVAKGTFYIHFQSKETLLIALQDRWVKTFCCALAAAMNRRHRGDFRGRLRAWVDAGIGGYLDRAALHDLVFHEFRPDGPRKKHDNPIVDQLAELLGHGTRAGTWSVKAPRFTAVLLFHALHGAFDDAVGTSGEVNRRRLARALEGFFYRAVGMR